MIAVDTNVLLRLFIADDEERHRKANSFFAARNAAEPAYVSLLVIAELYWLMRFTYRLDRPAVNSLLQRLLRSDDFVVEEADFLAAMLNSQERRGDVVNELIAHCARSAGCSRTVTFDRSAAWAIPSMELPS